jgi:cholera toxin transcriptional activator
MTLEATDRFFRFGVFEVHEAGGELRRNGIRVKLHSQPFQILLMLLNRPMGLVTREEMRQRLWDEDTFVDFDHGLNTAINKLREALGDLASQPRYIETVSGKGYRFLAPVTVETAASKLTGAPISSTPEVTSTSPASRVEPQSQVSLAELATDGRVRTSRRSILASSDELPSAPRKRVRLLLLLTQAMYVGFYLGALANLPEIRQVFWEFRLPSPGVPMLMSAVVMTAVALIPVRLFLSAAVAFDFQQLPAKFIRLFPLLLCMDLVWALSPFLLIHHMSLGLALGLTAALLYMPFAQRALILMYARSQT